MPSVTPALSRFSFFRVSGLTLLLSAALLSCGGKSGDSKTDSAATQQSNVITIKGSDTMVQLAQRWAEQFMKVKNVVQIQVNGGGSGTGISALINGTVDICTASRPIKDAENKQLQQKYGAPATEVKVAKDGLTIFLNQSNPVKELSFDQIRGIYTGSIKNWKDVGGKDAPIIVYGRENSSGTYQFLKEHVLENKDYTNTMQALPGTAAVVNAVKTDANGIGFGGAGYAKEVKECLVKKNATDVAVAPTRENIDNDKYPISRYLYFYMRKQPEYMQKSFIDWVLGPEGQKIVVDEGFFPVAAVHTGSLW